MAEIKNGAKQQASKPLLERELSFPRAVYASGNAGSNLKIQDYLPEQDIDSLIEWWLN